MGWVRVGAALLLGLDNQNVEICRNGKNHKVSQSNSWAFSPSSNPTRHFAGRRNPLDRLRCVTDTGSNHYPAEHLVAYGNRDDI